MCILLAALDQTVVIPAVPAIAADLNGFGHLSWIVTAYLIVSTVTTPLYGKLSDHFGRRRLLLAAIALFMLASVACAMAQSLGQLILFRALQGVGGGGLMSLAQAAIADVVAPRPAAATRATWPRCGRWRRSPGRWWAAGCRTICIALAVLDQRAARPAGHADVPPGPGAAGAARAGGRLRVDWLGAMLLTVAIVTFLLAMSWGGDLFDWLSPEMGGLALATLAALAALAWQERRAADPMLPPRLFANRAYVLGAAASALAALDIFLCIFALPLQFQLVRGADASLSGLLVVPFLLATVAGNFMAAGWRRAWAACARLLLVGAWPPPWPGRAGPWCRRRSRCRWCCWPWWWPCAASAWPWWAR